MNSTLTLYQTVSAGAFDDDVVLVPSGYGPASKTIRKSGSVLGGGALDGTTPKLTISHQDLSSDRRRSVVRIDTDLVPIDGVKGSVAGYVVLDINGLSLDGGFGMRRAVLTMLASFLVDGSTATLAESQVASDFINGEV